MPQTKSPTKQSQLAAMAQTIAAQKICPDLASSATQLVMGEGNLDTEVVFIGEAPGKAEDLAGRPFVGAAGKFLDVMLAQNGLDRQDVYITNIVKYRPPNNRDPLPEEIQAFMPFLIEQIRIIRPLLVVTLGRFAGSVFLPQVRISQDHGQPKRRAGLVYLPLYHPAAALYNGGMRQTLEADFAKIPAILELIKSSKPNPKNSSQPTTKHKEK